MANITLVLECSIGDVGPAIVTQMIILDLILTLPYFTARPNLIPKCIYLGKVLKSFFIAV